MTRFEQAATLLGAQGKRIGALLQRLDILVND